MQIGEEVFCMGAHISAICSSPGPSCWLLLFLALIALCQYANKLPRLLASAEAEVAKFMTENDENIADVGWITISGSMMCGFFFLLSTAPLVLASPSSLLLSSPLTPLPFFPPATPLPPTHTHLGLCCP